MLMSTILHVWKQVEALRVGKLPIEEQLKGVELIYSPSYFVFITIRPLGRYSKIGTKHTA